MLIIFFGFLNFSFVFKEFFSVMGEMLMFLDGFFIVEKKIVLWCCGSRGCMEFGYRFRVDFSES